MREVAFLIPGDPDLPTGGYAYDRAVAALLPTFGLRPIPVRLPGSFPDPSVADLETCAALVEGLPEGCPLLVDGLAYGAMPVDLVRRFSRPVVALCHHPLALETGISPARAEALRASETAALALAGAVIVTSPATGRLLSRDYAVPAERITVAVPGTAPKPRATGSGGPRLELLAVGSVVPRKGYDLLIAALAGLASRHWRLSIVGADRAPAHGRALEAQIAAAGLGERVRFLGAVGDDTLDDLYRRTDLFVSASHYEGYGMVLAEALRRGLPIVATTGGAAADTVPEGARLKVAPGDLEGLRAALDLAIEDEALRRALAAAALAAGEALPRWEDTARIVADCLRAQSEGVA